MSQRVAALHFSPRLGEVAANRAALRELLRQVQAELIVLPELCTTGFCLSLEQASALAEPAEGPSARWLAEEARRLNAVLVAGLALREGERLFNAQLVFEPTGALAGIYRKHHLFGEDHAWATPGPTPGGIVESAAGRLALLICHDLVYPQTLLGLARQRPARVAISTNWIGDGTPLPHSWQLAARLFDPAPVVLANRGGQEGPVRFDDPSAILSYRGGGRIGARGPGPQWLVEELPS